MQYTTYKLYPAIIILIVILFTVVFVSPTFAIVNPLNSPNNKFGVHIISATPDESSPAAQLVNSNGGDWGYITVLIENKDRNHDKWQAFFNDLRRRHLIPIVRLATVPEGNYWKLPNEGEETVWADFLDNLVWPTKNRYVTIYNEPNQGQEWEGRVDPSSYAKILDKVITALKAKNSDFFVLNAGFDADAPNKPPLYLDEVAFLQEMNQTIPGIFDKLDGWVSHSYPNPGFVGSPDAFGKGTVRTWAWEMEVLRQLGVQKTLPIFITETGWKHAEGLDYDKSLPAAEEVGTYIQTAFQEAWNSSQIIAVTPFLLNYQEAPFDHFSFKKMTGKSQDLKILGVSYPEYYPNYQALMDLNKHPGSPIQDNNALLTKGTVYSSLVARETYTIPLIFKNVGQSIWNESDVVQLIPMQGQAELNAEVSTQSTNKKIEPGQEETFYLHLKPLNSGTYKLVLKFMNGQKPFDTPPLEFSIDVKSAVVLQTTAQLTWKNDFSGDYLLFVGSDVVNTVTPLKLDAQGQSELTEARYLLPDYDFQFTLQKPFYKPKTITARMKSGINQLNFGQLQPDFTSVILNPKQIWNLLPFSNSKK